MANAKNHAQNTIQIPRPSLEEVERYIKKFENDKNLERYREQESAIERLFETYPKHDNVQEVLLKVAVLNDFFSTNLSKIGNDGTYKMSQHIVNINEKINLSQRIEKGCESVIKEIAEIPLKDEKEANAQGKKTKNMYSFATKYCAFHNAEKYPIYDRFVGKILNDFRENDNDFRQKCADSLKNIDKKFTRKEDLKDYPTLKCVIEAFKSHYGLEKYDFKQMDRYFWLAGQEYFA